MLHIQTLMKQNLLVFLVNPVVFLGDLRERLNHHK